MLQASWNKVTFYFTFPAGTSRGILHQKDSWFIEIWDKEKPNQKGTGECSIIKGLSRDKLSKLEGKIEQICNDINNGTQPEKFELNDYPALKFAIETAMFDLQCAQKDVLFPSEFTEGKKGIRINGLIWIDTIDTMWEAFEKKIRAGFTCIKIKIGAYNWSDELALLKKIRKKYPAEALEIRVDANGAYTFVDAQIVLEDLHKLSVHSIEQPIKQGQASIMAELCKISPVFIALDEELINDFTREEKAALLNQINPKYLILKPSLLGGFKECEEWISLANERKIGWWITSALESNIGLSAIAQWTYTLNNSLHQGLGTGQLFTNNTSSPLDIKGEQLWFNT